MPLTSTPQAVRDDGERARPKKAMAYSWCDVSLGLKAAVSEWVQYDCTRSNLGSRVRTDEVHTLRPLIHSKCHWM